MNVEEVANNVFRVEVPLPDNPLRALNAYLIRADALHPGWRGRSLLIDNGFNRQECLEALLEALDTLGVPVASLDLFVSHLHSDHGGLTSRLMSMAGLSAWVFAGVKDGTHINMYFRQSFRPPPGSAAMSRAGLDRELVESMTVKHPGLRYATDAPCPFTPVLEGDLLPYGGYELKVLEMPGHTPGLLCLYDRENKILFSSDHILGDITPNIMVWGGVRDALGDYLKSLAKARTLDVGLCLTGHRSILSDCRGRITALERHHAARLDEVLGILDHRPESSAVAVAARMTWSIRAKDWDDFPPPQKWFACGEALAHLTHLRVMGKVESRKSGGRILYQRVEA